MARILFASTPGLGHLHPLLPLAVGAGSRGHKVRFVGESAPVSAVVTPLGFDVHPGGVSLTGDDLADVRRTMPASGDGNVHFLAHAFIRLRAARMLPELLDLIDEWRPDLIVHELFAFAAAVAGELRGIPHACLEVGAIGREEMRTWPAVVEELDHLRARVGLTPDPGMESVARHRYLTSLPGSLRPAGSSLPVTGRELQPSTYGAAAGSPLTPQVYATLGSEVPGRPDLWPHVFVTLLDGLGRSGLRSLLTVGSERDPADLGSPPGNVTVERFVPNGSVIPHASVVVNHGGSGTVLGSLAAGVTMVIVPFFADQPVYARRCEAAGVAITLQPDSLAPGRLAEAIVEVARKQSYRDSARHLQDEILAMPGVAEVVGDLEGLIIDENLLRFAESADRPPR